MTDLIQKAESLFRAGKPKEARQLLDELVASSSDIEVKLRAILLKLEAVDLDILDDLKRSCDEGMTIARNANKKNELAYLMARKAALLAFYLGFYQKRFRELKLSPTWFEFSLESDKKEWKSRSPVTFGRRYLALEFASAGSDAVSELSFNYTKSQFCEPSRSVSVGENRWLPSGDQRNWHRQLPAPVQCRAPIFLRRSH